VGGEREGGICKKKNGHSFSLSEVPVVGKSNTISAKGRSVTEKENLRAMGKLYEGDFPSFGEGT